jgi:hypothetical protein
MIVCVDRIGLGEVGYKATRVRSSDRQRSGGVAVWGVGPAGRSARHWLPVCLRLLLTLTYNRLRNRHSARAACTKLLDSGYLDYPSVSGMDRKHQVYGEQGA